MNIYFVVNDVKIYIKDIENRDDIFMLPVIHTTYNCTEAKVFNQKEINNFKKVFKRFRHSMTFLDPDEDRDMDIDEIFVT